jgi:excisionase family DNA binding protein
LRDEHYRTVRSGERSGASKNDAAVFARGNPLPREPPPPQKGGLKKSAILFRAVSFRKLSVSGGSLLRDRVQQSQRTFLFSSKKFACHRMVASRRGLEEQESMLQDDHVTVQEAAEYLRISIATVYRLVRAGKLTAVKVKPQGAKGSLRVSRKLVFEFSDGHPKTASLEQAPPPIASGNNPEPPRDSASLIKPYDMDLGGLSTSAKC